MGGSPKKDLEAVLTDPDLGSVWIIDPTLNFVKGSIRIIDLNLTVV